MRENTAFRANESNIYFCGKDLSDRAENIFRAIPREFHAIIMTKNFAANAVDWPFRKPEVGG